MLPKQDKLMAIEVRLKSGTIRTFEDSETYGAYLGWDVHTDGSLSVGQSNINAYSVHYLASFPAGSWDSVDFVSAGRALDRQEQE